MIDKEILERINKDDLNAAWQSHRKFCLELSIKLGATDVEKAITMANELSVYILGGTSK